ncbi:MAG: peptide chain release factor N(5)-glutamine methyltransferase [Bdellovibrionales bacterium]|nr:peptide chain release factor N(5)-glutamine methyltransferase [Bdellovibrionales bacterium]
MQNFFSDFSGKLPDHELELLLESAFHRRFPNSPRLSRQMIYSEDFSSDLDWVTQARIWAEKRLSSRVPLQHLTREQNFFGRYFEVGPEVLIPRPETEVLMESVLHWIGQENRGVVFGAEIGTGSGIIPITLALESRSVLRFLATELSPEALRRAQDNAKLLGLSSDAITWIKIQDRSDVTSTLLQWVQRSSKKLDFLISNPPYLKEGFGETEDQVEKFEPSEALFAPEHDPLFYYRAVASAASSLVEPGGMIFLEIPHERAQSIADLFGDGFEAVRVIPDLTGKSRVLQAKVSVWMK